MYEIIIIGGGAAGLFCAGQLPKNTSKCILEKSKTLGTKVLLSGGGRCNFSNANIEPLRDYFGQDKKALPSLFHAFSNNEMKDFLEKNGIQTQQEDNGRLILKSGKAQELNNLLIKTATENNTEIKCNQEIINVSKKEELFIIETSEDVIEAKHLIIATGGKSFPQVGATDFGLQIAKQFGLAVTEVMPGLGGLETNENLSELTGNATPCTIQLFHNNKNIYEQTGNLLFTHRGISGPIVFNTSNALAEYCIKQQFGFSHFDQFSIKLHIDPTTTIKKITNHFHLTNKQPVNLTIKSFRPRKETKVMLGGIHMKEINPSMESKKVPGLYFIGEALDITGKTGGYNLQRCRTSAYACTRNFKN